MSAAAKQTFMILRFFLFVILISALQAPIARAEYEYLQRSNRMEGLRRVPMAGRGISLLSFVAYSEPLSLTGSPVLRIRFFLLQPSDVYITAVELRRHGPSHYQMNPLQTSWDSGWQEFGPWPTSEVLQPLNIAPDEVGVVARLTNDRPGSGTIAPILLYERNYPRESTNYTVHFLPRNTLSRIDYSVIRDSDGEVVVSRRLRNLAANVPFEVTFSLAGQESGTYRLLVNTRELGRTYGASRQFAFYHRHQLRD